MRKKKDRFLLTLNGVISTEVDVDTARRIYDAIELYAYRTGKNGIVVANGGSFVEMEEVK